MEKEIKKFVQISKLASAALLALIAVFALSTIPIYLVIYRRIITYVIIAAFAAFLLLWLVAGELIKADRRGGVRRFNIYALRLGIKLVLPVFMHFTGLFRGDKDWLRRLYISVNNMIARYELMKKPAERMLVLLPHCMQNKECGCRITEDIRNCRRCGGCKIGEISAITNKYHIRTVVEKGGTAARNTVKEFKPDLILAVACERELVSGIGDVGSVPVIGIINQRPNGYCANTTVDMLQLKKTLNELLGEISELRNERLGGASCGPKQL